MPLLSGWTVGRGSCQTAAAGRKSVFSRGVKHWRGTNHVQKGLLYNKAADLKLDKLRVEKRRWFGSAEQRLL